MTQKLPPHIKWNKNNEYFRNLGTSTKKLKSMLSLNLTSENSNIKLPIIFLSNKSKWYVLFFFVFQNVFSIILQLDEIKFIIIIDMPLFKIKEGTNIDMPIYISQITIFLNETKWFCLSDIVHYS